MINLYNQVPSVYTSASRDFQYMCWLFNIVLNSVKHNVDGLYTLPNIGSDPKLTELLAMTLGFKVKRNYDEKQLTALVTILPTVLKYKGTKKAIEMAARALVKATGSLGEAKVSIKDTVVEVTLPKDLIDVSLFLDLLDYILPAGMSCRVIRKNEESNDIDDIIVKYKDVLTLLDNPITPDLAWKSNEQFVDSTGLSGLYNLDNSGLVFGKALTFNNNTFETTNITVRNCLIASTMPPVWALEAYEQGFRIRYGEYYLSRKVTMVDSKPKLNLVLSNTESEAAVWNIISTSRQNNETGYPVEAESIYHITSIGAESYYLSYNHDTGQFGISLPGERKAKGDTFELYIYQETVKDDIIAYEPLTTGVLSAVKNGSDITKNICIAVQGVPDFTSNIKKLGNSLGLNAGLLSNTVIPTLADSKLVEGDKTPSIVALYSTENDGTHNPLFIKQDNTNIQLKAKNRVQEL